MKIRESAVKKALCDLVVKGKTWAQAYAYIIDSSRKNAEDIHAKGEELANMLKAAGDPESFINMRLKAYTAMHDFEMSCVDTAKKLKREGYKG